MAMDVAKRRRKLSLPDFGNAGAVRARLLLPTPRMPPPYSPERLRLLHEQVQQRGRAGGYRAAPFAPLYESARLAALHELGVLDTARDEAYDDMAQLACDLTECPIAAISFVDADRQWVKAEVGWGSGPPTTRDVSICAHSFEQPGVVMVLRDAAADERFRHNPLIAGAPHVRFYAGAPLVTESGYPVGTLCVIDRRPRPDLTEKDFARLKLLARTTMSEILLHKSLRESQGLKERMNRLLENVFPSDVALRLLQEPRIHDVVECTVCFVDLADFTAWAARETASNVVTFLDTLFCAFDEVVTKMGVCKIKTLGDGYLFASGIPSQQPNHAALAVETASMFMGVLELVNAKMHTVFKPRLGLASGSAVAGVVGNTRCAYDLWGATVNMASRVEGQAQLGRVTVAPSTYQLLQNDARFRFVPDPRAVELKGIGPVQLYVLE